MDYLLEKKITLNESPKHSGLYKWCLNERDEKGEIIDRDLIPFSSRLYFTASSLSINRELTIQHEYSINNEVISPAKTLKKRFIHGVLHPGLCKDGIHLTDYVSYIMFGTNREIKAFDLRILEADENEEDGCHVSGSPSYDVELDFQNLHISDRVEISLIIKKETFIELCEIIDSNKVDIFYSSLYNVSGFYSHWSPSIRTESIKILTKYHNIIGKENSIYKIPILGNMGEFELNYSTYKPLDLKSKNIKVNIQRSFEKDEFHDPMEDYVDPASNDLNKFIEDKTLENSLKKIHFVLLVISTILFINLFK